MKKSWPHSLAEVLLLLRVVSLLHRFRRHRMPEDFGPLLNSLTPLNESLRPNPARLQKAARYVDAICTWLPYLKSDACIPRSLTLYAIARRYGQNVTWVCGVKKRGLDHLDGHAWIEQDGTPVHEPDSRAGDYAVTFRYPR